MIKGKSWRWIGLSMPRGGAVDGLYQDYEADDQVASRFAEVLNMTVYDAKPFVLEGGAIHSDGQGTHSL